MFGFLVIRYPCQSAFRCTLGSSGDCGGGRSGRTRTCNLPSQPFSDRESKTAVVTGRSIQLSYAAFLFLPKLLIGNAF
jgi:hypothetical protein